MGHDLDDEELRATRRMFRLDRKENKVISREYVEKNYIKKAKLREFIESELEIIHEIKNKNIATARQIQIDGMEAVYLAIKNVFLGE